MRIVNGSSSEEHRGGEIYFLGERMEIRRYDLHLDINDVERSYEGAERIHLQAEGKPLVLNTVDLEIRKLRVNGVESAYSVDFAKEELTVETNARGETTVELEFAGTIGRALTGFYAAETEETEMFTTQFESSGARRTFPCFDQPACKAQFCLSLTIREHLDAVSNMPVQSEARSDGKKTVTFETTPAMSTYLLYFGIGEFDEKRVGCDGKEIILIAPRGRLTKSDFPLEIAAKSLRFCEEYFDIVFMLPKMHLISVPEFAAGAMENWGAVTMREVFLRMDSSTSRRYRKLTAEVIAHEIVHFWFGNLVTMKWWNDLWLNESFATFMSYKMVNQMYPEWDAWSDFVLMRTEAALRGDSLAHSHPIEADVQDPDAVAQIFDEISYGKGGSILRMIESYIGEHSFRDGIRQYLKKFSYGNAVGEDLWNSLEEVSAQPVNRIMEDWIRKKGYPVVRVSKRGDKLHLEQEQFLLAEADSDSTWPIPLTVGRKTKTESVLYDRKTLDLDAPGFTKLNVDQTGFYRVSYDEEILKEILSDLNELSDLDRWGIVNDLFAFLLSGRISLRTYLDSLKMFEKESTRVAVEEISGQLSRLFLLLPGPTVLAEFSKKFLRIQLERLGERRADEPENDAILRGTLSRELVIRDPEVASKLSSRFSAFRDSDPDMRSAIAMAEALTHNSITSLFEQFHSGESDEDRTKLISSMGWLHGEENLSKAMELIRTEEIKRQDRPVFYVSASANPKAREFMLDHLEPAIRELQKVFIGTGTPSRTVEQIIPLLGIGRERRLLDVVQKLSMPDIEMGIGKGTELLRIYSKFVNRCTQECMAPLE
jgi:tricorn protease interacting factor F2/3